MSTSSTASGAGSGQTPAIRTFQLDSGAIGNLSSSVNLFRGDVNLNQSLFTLPGRNQDGGLDVDVTLLYQSNVHEQATRWNRDAPTGVVGLGWSLPLTYVEASDTGSPVAATRQYTLYDNGTPNGLTQQPQASFLFTMDADLAGELEDGQPVPADVLSAFRGHGLSLDESTMVTGDGPWVLNDDPNEQQFSLELTGSTLDAYDGGEAYQLQNYQFWKVIYYPRYERWLIVTDGAVRRSLGGTASGGTVAWQVWWSDDSGDPIWSGPSTLTDGQVQVARAWYQSTVTDRFGSTVSYDYDTVEQAVGSGGLTFTKAVYLSLVTDVFGRTVTLSYGDKLWDSGETDPREYADPHRDVPSDDPSPYQDRYETRYLDELVVQDTNAETLFSVQLTYDPRPQVDGAESAVANVTDNTGTLEGDTYKRFLTGITLLDQDGVAQPSLDLSYYLDESTDESSPGALATITYPEGGIATYSYSHQDLAICQRSLEVPKPTELEGGASPRVFFGSDYAVVCYYNQSDPQLSMQVFTWAGSWLSWQLDDSDALIDTGGIDLSTLQVLPNQDFIALTFDRTTPAEKAVYVFQRNTAQPGQWMAATIDGVTTAKNTPTLKYSESGSDVTFVGGSTFFLVSQMDTSSLDGSYDVVTFRWTSMSWTRETQAVSEYTWACGQSEYYATLDTTGAFVVHYLDGTLEWQTGDSAALTGLDTVDLASVALVPGSGLVAVSNLQSQNSQQNTYAIWTAQWSSTYAVDVESFGTFTDEFGQDNAATTWVPTIVEDTLVAINGNLLRFNGQDWEENTNLSPGILDSGWTQRYAFGPDYALQIIAPLTGIGAATGAVMAFDPEQDCSDWTRSPTEMEQDLPAQTEIDLNWPTNGGEDYAVMGPYVYFRGTASNWGDVIGAEAMADIDTLVGSGFELDSESLVNEAPDFLSYTATQGSSEQEVQSILIENGTVDGDPVAFDDQKMVSPGEDGLSGAGVSAAGTQVFVTYPASATSFDDAQSVFLNRYAGDSVSGPVTHYALTGLIIDDGYQDPIATVYVPDADTAGCDASGQVVKYFSATVYPGSSDPDDPQFGWAISNYLNGLNDLTGDNYYDMLDGMLVSSELYDNDGELKQCTTNTWEIYEQVASSPDDGSAPTIQLRGGWVSQVEQEIMKDGVTSTTTTTFVPPDLEAPYTGQPVTVSQTQYGGDGAEQTFVQTSTYGVSVDDGLLAIHALTDIAQKTTTQTTASDSVPVQASATTYVTWASALGQGVQTPAAEASFGLFDAGDQFPYDSYEPGSTPDGWVLAARTTGRTPYGQESQSVDSLGVSTATLYDADDQFAVARVANAQLAGCAYLGFETYEDTSPWSLDAVTYDADDARTGTRSAVLPGGASASLSVTVEPESDETPYIAGGWYKTPAGFEPSSGAGWSIVVTVDGVAQPATETSFEDTSGEWSYVTLPVELDAGGDATAASQIEIGVTVANDTGDDVHLDSLLVLPLVNVLTARTFDEATHQVTSTMDAGGRTSFTYYDRAWQATVSVSAAGQARELAQRFLSRHGSPDGAFQASSPNAELTLHAAGGGLLETFRDGAAWQSRWQPGEAGDWSEGDGVLTHDAGATDALTWIGDSIEGTFAVYFELQTSGSPELEIAVGDIAVGIDENGYYGSQGGSSWAPLIEAPSLARHWLLVCGDGVTLFFGDGQLLFSEQTTPSDNDIAINAGGDAASFRHLTLFEGIRLGLSYNDATARQRQVQQLRGDDTVIAEVVFDALNRQIATTRCAPGSFGSGADLAVLQYSPGFLDVNAFLTSTATTWEMTGDVADYYRGQSEGTIQRSDDQGYPYRGTRYEASPRSMILETGLPGKPYAIDLTVAADDRQTVQYSWSTNSGDEGDLPANEYYQNTLTGPMKTSSVQVTDQLSQQVGTSFLDDSGATLSQTSAVREYTAGSDGPATTLTLQQPNATTAGPQSDPDQFEEQSTIDALQRTAWRADPDTGETQFVADSTGRMRCVQPALDAGETWFIYYKYDALGRMTEEGTVAQEWDRDELTQLVEDPSWPTQDNTVAVSIVYDGDGSEPTLVGKKSLATTYNPEPASASGAGDCTVTETFGYDAAGRMTSVRMQLDGASSADGTIGYSYNALSEVVQADMPSGAPLPSVYYNYDDQGRIASVGSTTGGADLAELTYSPDGLVQTQDLAAGSWLQSIDYQSPNWIGSIVTTSSDATQSLSLEYSYDADAAIKTRDVSFDFAASTDSLSEVFEYDGQRRLASATGATDVEIVEYDPNGNIWTVDQDGVTQQFTCVDGADTLQEVDLDGTASPMTYNARGQLTSGLDRSLTYDDATAMTTSITTGDGGIRLGYGSTQQRVLKQGIAGSDSDIVYFRGAGQVPVATLSGDEWSVWVQGPTGLLAVQTSETLLFPLKDVTQNTWAVVDSSSLVDSYTYLPFGQLATANETSGFAYLFQGQEWDAEVGLYNFRTRMYDPVLRRFLAPDPARQFASPYVFAGNAPLVVTDPTGEISTWGQVGIGAAMVAVTAIGIGLTVCTFGGSDEAAAAGDAALLSLEVGAETSTVAGGETAGATATEVSAAGASDAVGTAGSGTSVAAESTATGASEVSSGASTSAAESAASTSSWDVNLTNLASNIAGSTLTGAGTSGLSYDIQHGRDFTAKGFFEAVGIGAASGFVSGAAGAAGDVATAAGGLADVEGAAGVAARIGAKSLSGAIGGALSSDVSTVLTNASRHQPWYQGLAKSTAQGFAQGAAQGAATGAWSERVNIAKMGGVSDENIGQVQTMVDRVQAAALSTDAKMIYGTATFFLVSGYLIWGTADNFGPQS